MKGLILNFDVKNQIICYDEKNQAVADSINYLRCRFTFTDDWDCGNIKYCVFYGAQSEGGPISVPLVPDGDGGYCCAAPFEVIKPPFFKLSVYCEENGVLITSNLQKVFVRPSGYSDDTQEAKPLPPTDEYTRVNTETGESGIPFIRQSDGILEYSKDGLEWTAAKTPSPEIPIKSGTWEPILYGSAVLGSATYNERRGTWAIIGNIYKIDLYIELSSLGGAEGYLNIFGLPFTPGKIIMNHNYNALLRSTISPTEQIVGAMGDWIGIEIWENYNFKRYMSNNDLSKNSIIRLSFEWQA